MKRSLVFRFLTFLRSTLCRVGLHSYAEMSFAREVKRKKTRRGTFERPYEVAECMFCPKIKRTLICSWRRVRVEQWFSRAS